MKRVLPIGGGLRTSGNLGSVSRTCGAMVATRTWRQTTRKDDIPWADLEMEEIQVLPDEVLCWLLLRRANLSAQSRLSVQASVANSLKFDAVERATSVAISAGGFPVSGDGHQSRMQDVQRGGARGPGPHHGRVDAGQRVEGGGLDQQELNENYEHLEPGDQEEINMEWAALGVAPQTCRSHIMELCCEEESGITRACGTTAWTRNSCRTAQWL